MELTQADALLEDVPPKLKGVVDLGDGWGYLSDAVLARECNISIWWKRIVPPWKLRANITCSRDLRPG
jgi:hypothetical protein